VNGVSNTCFLQRCATLENTPLSFYYNTLLGASHAWDVFDFVRFSV
jgi:hypothetical protein